MDQPRRTRLFKKNKIVYPIFIFAFLALAMIISTSSIPRPPDEDEYADTIIYNGPVVTIDDNFSIVEAIAIKEDQILALGPYLDLIEQHGLLDHTLMINLDNKAVLPGIIDGHTHLLGYALWNEWGLDGGQALALSYGFTTLNEKYADEYLISAFQEVEAKGEMNIRVNVFASYNHANLDQNNETVILSAWFPDNRPIRDANRMVRIPGIKIFVDGAFMIQRGAWAVSEPFPQEDMDGWLRDITSNPYGDLYLEQDELEPIIEKAQKMGFQVAFHAMGDRAIETVVNAVDNVTGGSNTNYRHQIEHNSYLRPDLVEHCVKIDMVHSLIGYYHMCTEIDSLFCGDYFNTSWYVNRYSLPGRGQHVYLETDFGFEHEIGDMSHTRNINPFLHLFGLVTRSRVSPDGKIIEPEPCLAEHEITVEQALKILTIEGAYAVGQEEVIGSLEVGKYADLIIVPKSPLDIDPNELKDLYPLLTMVGGDRKYERANSDLHIWVLNFDPRRFPVFFGFCSILAINTIFLSSYSKKNLVFASLYFLFAFDAVRSIDKPFLR